MARGSWTPTQVEKGPIIKATTLLRRSPRITSTLQNSSEQRRRSLRLQSVSQTTPNSVQQTKACKRIREVQFDPNFPKRLKRTRNAEERIHSPTQHHQRPINSRKRYREEQTEQPQKRHRFSPASRETVNQKSPDPSRTSDITQWVLKVARETVETQDQPDDQPDYLHHMHRFLAERKPVQRKRSSSSIASNSQSDQGYQDARYATNLEANGSFMKEYRGELPEEAKRFNDKLRRMLEKEQPMPKDSLFSNDYFEDTMDMIQGRNEACIIETISQLMFPHVEAMAIRGAKHLTPFIQSFNEGWNSCKKITQTRPQPDSAIGFRLSVFSAEQLEKLQPYLGDLEAKSDFRATFYMYFPFLTFEVKRGSVGLDIADRQNAHSMTVALRGLVALFRLVGREQEIHGKTLTMSFSFDHRMARVYSYLPIIKDHKTEVWREEIDAFDFRTGKGKDRWKCLQYSLNALDVGLELLDRIRSGIDDWTPDSELEASQPSETSSSRPSGLSQIFNNQDLSEAKEITSGQPHLQQITLETSTNPSSTKKKKTR